MKKKNGFIAISLIYSFFLVFLMIMLANAMKNAQTRQLLKVLKDDIKSELNEREFIITSLENRSFQIGENIDLVGDSWEVIKDNGNSVTLILKRSLNAEEITNALNVDATDKKYFGTCNNTSCQVRMCMNQYSDNFCYATTNVENALYYNWDNSIAKKIVNHWFENNNNLQKICRLQYNELVGHQTCDTEKGKLIYMIFSDGVRNNNEGYIRLATKDEINSNPSWITHDAKAWTITKDQTGSTNGKSKIYGLDGATYQNADTLTIRPVIQVQKG